MRTLASVFVSLLLAGCNSDATHFQKQSVNPTPRDTWTSDAIHRGDIDAVKERVLSRPEFLNQRDYYNDTPLQTAVAADNLSLVEFLLQQNADPNAEVDDGYTCLFTAIDSDEHDSIAVAKLLIGADADIHAIGTNGWTPLHMAAARGHVQKCRMLIDAGADVNRRTKIDSLKTPLMEAAFSGQPETTQLLLDSGADPTMRDTIHNRTPIEIARDAANGPDPEVVEFLKQENIQIDVEEMFADTDLSKDELEQMKSAIGNIDMTQNYIDNSTGLAESGDHASVIQILESHAPRR